MDHEIFSPKYFHCLGLSLYGILNNHESFRAHFGTSPLICSQLWIRTISPKRHIIADGLKPDHLLWALHFIKTYNTMYVLSAKVGVDRKTYAKWIWIILRLIRREGRFLVSS